MANQCGRAPRWQCRLGYLSAGVECTYGELPNFGKRRRVGRVFSDLYPVAFFHADGRETERGREVGRRCYFDARRVDSVALVIYPADLAGHTERKGTSAKLPNASPPWRVSTDFTSWSFPHSGGMETKGDGIAGRGCFFGRVGSVCFPP